MVASNHPVFYTFREYIAHEAASNVKHEYLEGRIYAMAGGTPEHSALIPSVMTQIGTQLRGSQCRAHMADLRVRVAETGLATYPDLAILCGPWERDPEDKNTVVNPTVLVEVLSPSTAAYDRGEKFEHYKLIPTLQQYVLVAHDRRAIEVWTRDATTEWALIVYGAGETARVDSIGMLLPVDQIYDDASEPTG